jgi:hypothetical protein
MIKGLAPNENNPTLLSVWSKMYLVEYSDIDIGIVTHLISVLGLSLFCTISRPDLGPTQPPAKWVLGFFPTGKLRHNVDNSPPSGAKVNKGWS